MTNKPQGSESGPTKSRNPLTWLMFAVAALVMCIVKPSQYLRRRAYSDSAIAPVPFLFGLVAAAGAGVELGSHVYPLGIEWWLSLGVGAVIAVYYYLWPALYLAIFQWSFRFAAFLWRRVPDADARSANEYGISPWFIRLLTRLAYVTVVVSCLVLWYNLGAGIHAKLDWSGAFLQLISLAIATVAGAVVALLVGALSFGLLSQGPVALAGASGIAAAYILSPYAETLIKAHELPDTTSYAIEGGVVLVWMAYIFPLTVLLVSRLFRGLGEFLVRILDRFFSNFFDRYGRFLDAAYSDSDRNYVGFVRQVICLTVVAVVGRMAWGYDTIGGATLLAEAARTALPVMLVYIVGGYAVRLLHNFALGVLCSATLAYIAYTMSAVVGVPFGVVGAVGAGVLAFFLNMIFGFPLLYVAIKFVVNPLLASWLGGPLVRMHEQLSGEIFSSLSHTYREGGDYGKFFALTTGLVVTAATYFGLGQVVHALDFSPLWASVITIATTAAVYLASGKVFARYGNVLIGVLLAVGSGVWGGVATYLYFNHELWHGIAGFFVTALATGFIAFPVVYVITRAILSAIAVTSWALPVLSVVHGFFFAFVERFWNGVVLAYRTIEAAWQPAWQAVSKMWDESWASAKEMFEQAFGKK